MAELSDCFVFRLKFRKERALFWISRGNNNRSLRAQFAKVSSSFLSFLRFSFLFLKYNHAQSRVLRAKNSHSISSPCAASSRFFSFLRLHAFARHASDRLRSIKVALVHLRLEGTLGTLEPPRYYFSWLSSALSLKSQRRRGCNIFRSCFPRISLLNHRPFAK